jgi:hypothetical protein
VEFDPLWDRLTRGGDASQLVDIATSQIHAFGTVRCVAGEGGRSAYATIDLVVIKPITSADVPVRVVANVENSDQPPLFERMFAMDKECTQERCTFTIENARETILRRAWHDHRTLEISVHSPLPVGTEERWANTLACATPECPCATAYE